MTTLEPAARDARLAAPRPSGSGPDCHTSAPPARPEQARALSAALKRGPNVPCRPRVFRAVIHVIQKSDGTGNYPDDATSRATLAQTIDWVNANWMSNLAYDTLPAITDYVADLKVLIRLTGVYFHQDDNLWELGPTHYCDPDFYNALGTNRRKDFNIFILGHPGGGCAPSPYFFNFLGSSNPGTSADWAMSQLFGHEFGHSWGLAHTFQPDPISDTPPEKAVGWIAPDSLKTSNNLMGYNYQRTTVHRQQQDIVHALLRSSSSSMRDIVLAPPSPRALARDFESGLFGVDDWGDNTGDLARAFWTPANGPGEPPRWNIETIPSPDFRVIPGSLMSTSSVTPARVYGVTDRYDIFRTEPVVVGQAVHTLDALAVQSIGAAGAPAVTPGSLCDGLASNVVYAVNHSRRIVRFVVGASTSTWTQITGPVTFAAASLVATEWNGVIRIFAVAENYIVMYVTSGGSSMSATGGIKAVPGSLVRAGALGLFGVNETGFLMRIDTSVVGSVSTIGGLHGGSLVWHGSTNQLFGVDPGGVVSRLVDPLGSIAKVVLPGVPAVVPGSLVDGMANGLFGVTPGGDIVRISYDTTSSTWGAQVITHWGAKVVPGSLIADAVDGGRAYGVNADGQLVGTYGSGAAAQYSIIE